MNKTLYSPRLGGRVRVPASKSEAHRALISAALAYLYGGEASPRRVTCADSNEDIEATARCLAALGAKIAYADGAYLVTPITALPPSALLDCGESGSTLRFLLPVCCALGGTHIAPEGFTVSLVGHGRLPERPLSPLYEELVAHGASLSPMEKNPLTVSGKLTAGAYAVDGSVSSQFISGLCFALPLLKGDSTLSVTGKIESAPYIGITLDALSRVTSAITGELPTFSISGRASLPPLPDTAALPPVGGDWSGAAFLLVAGLLAREGASVTVEGLDPASRQGDSAVIDVLCRMGGRIDVTATGDVTAHPFRPSGCIIDATQIPDLVPILAVAAAVAEGDTVISGASRLRLKESDRLATVSAMITSLGGDVTETADGLIIHGKPSLVGGTVDAAGDHRIAMSAAIAATVCKTPVTIRGAECVAKSYPAFWDHLSSLLLEGEIR